MYMKITFHSLPSSFDSLSSLIHHFYSFWMYSLSHSFLFVHFPFPFFPIHLPHPFQSMSFSSPILDQLILLSYSSPLQLFPSFQFHRSLTYSSPVFQSYSSAYTIPIPPISLTYSSPAFQSYSSSYTIPVSPTGHTESSSSVPLPFSPTPRNLPWPHPLTYTASPRHP